MSQEQSLPKSESPILNIGQNSNRMAANEDSLVNQQNSEEDHGIKFKDWGFKIDRLFEVAYRFYKKNESKAFHPSFDVRNQMNALILQARYGNFDDGKAPDIGTLDLVGKSRRHQWSLLKGTSKSEAMSNFICTLDEICPLFKAYAEAIKISSGYKLGIQENGRDWSDSEKRIQSDTDEQLKAIHTSLCRQTYNQFKNYAVKQYPNDIPKQKYLISSLQEQYYQQYISTMKPNLSANEKKKNSSSSPTISESSTIESNQITNNTFPNINQVQLDALAQPLSDHSDTETKETTLVTESYQPYVNSPAGVQPIDNVLAENDNVSASARDPNILYAQELQQTLHAKSNLDIGTLLQTDQKDVVFECSKEASIKENSSETADLHNEDHGTGKFVIGTFESYPEPKPILKSKESQQRSLALNILNYFGDSGTTQNQNLQPVITSLYRNSAPNTSNEQPQHPLPFCPPLSPQQSILPLQHEQFPNNQRTPAMQELNTNLEIQSVARPSQSVDTRGCDSSSGSSSPLQQSVTTYEPLESATIWTKKGVSEFKDSLTDDKHGGSYIVKQGTLLTIEVPTYPDGRYIYWEFTTEDYDIGFGLDFVYEANLSKPLAMKIYEETDGDDDDVDELGHNDVNFDLESANELVNQNDLNGSYALIESRAEKFARTPNTVSIVPTYRRDSHEEVFVGRHRYPGRGYYLLKFDNTYSVLRSKPLFFRICYFI